MDTRYLSLDEAMAIHAHQIARYGGTPGIRDRTLLESALAMPKATFGAELLHPTLSEQAAAYVFHLVKNHPFLDGNKRVGLACGRTMMGTDVRCVSGVLLSTQGCRALRATA